MVRVRGSREAPGCNTTVALWGVGLWVDVDILHSDIILCVCVLEVTWLTESKRKRLDVILTPCHDMTYIS